jgi:hypothetical protein
MRLPPSGVKDPNDLSGAPAPAIVPVVVPGEG